MKNHFCPSLFLSSVCFMAFTCYTSFCWLFPREILLSEQVSPQEQVLAGSCGVQAVCGKQRHRPEGCSVPSMIEFFLFLDFGESACVNEAYLWELQSMLLSLFWYFFLKSSLWNSGIYYLIFFKNFKFCSVNLKSALWLNWSFCSEGIHCSWPVLQIHAG